jgi:division protein CdvB (Snf7/Vps24/ESCRT-III family)
MADKLSGFVKNWNGGEPQQTIADKIKGALKGNQPLRYKLAMAHYKLRTTLSRLDVYIGRLQERDRRLFERVVEGYMSKDTARAAMYANEVAEIRKVVRQLIATQIALEQVELRLETFQEIGDVFTNLIPVIGVVKELKSAMKGVMPEIGLELAELEETLQGVVIEAGEFTGASVEYAVTSPEARKILDEAAALAQQRMKEKFPDLPTFAAAQPNPSNNK